MNSQERKEAVRELHRILARIHECREYFGVVPSELLMAYDDLSETLGKLSHAENSLYMQFEKEGKVL